MRFRFPILASTAAVFFACALTLSSCCGRGCLVRSSVPADAAKTASVAAP